MKNNHLNTPQKHWHQQVQVVACLIVSIFLVSLAGCKKDKIDKTPSQSGANTIYFEAEGMEWTPTDTYMSFDASVEYLNDSLFYLTISAKPNKEDLNSTIEIFLYDIKSVGKYNCNSNIRKLYYIQNNGSSSDKFCAGCLIQEEIVHITKLDTLAKIISGTFSFVSQCQDSSLLEVKNGWFDYHYPYNK